MSSLWEAKSLITSHGCWLIKKRDLQTMTYSCSLSQAKINELKSEGQNIKNNRFIMGMGMK